ncbi:hypothetical protein CAPTEDRAFT_193774 [Capitella teleta]|uniref:Uncharacterized protein n=1 Tax=Capitella teleta TaxID=283909 RepID=R7VG69_CAPTE|nr:hypothetical protein CAPTEDRAFT_193774 [Capitella teleta]|eukprot:ELU15296.1 hypothetical protein CAPTEDRAFT_193774 [Capitella teleta]
MKLMYTMTLAISTDSYPTAGLIIPLHQKLLSHFSATNDASPFQKKLKEGVHANFKGRYDEKLVKFLEEASCFYQRFKDSALEEAGNCIAKQLSSSHQNDSSPEAAPAPPPAKKPCLLTEIFSDEDEQMLGAEAQDDDVLQNLAEYRRFRKLPMDQDPVFLLEGEVPVLASAISVGKKVFDYASNKCPI